MNAFDHAYLSLEICRVRQAPILFNLSADSITDCSERRKAMFVKLQLAFVN